MNFNRFLSSHDTNPLLPATPTAPPPRGLSHHFKYWRWSINIRYITSRCFRSGTARCLHYSGHIVPLTWSVTTSHWRTFRVQPQLVKAKNTRTKTIVCTLSRISLITVRKRSLWKGNVFTSMCQEFCPQGGEVYTLLGRHPPPADGYGSRRYASYWNAFSFAVNMLLLVFIQTRNKWTSFVQIKTKYQSKNGLNTPEFGSAENVLQ